MTDKTNGTDVSSLKGHVDIFIIPCFPKNSGLMTNLLVPFSNLFFLRLQLQSRPYTIKHAKVNGHVDEKRVSQTRIPVAHVR